MVRSTAVGLDSGFDIAAALADYIGVFTAVAAERDPKESSCSSEQAKAPEKSRASNPSVQNIGCFLFTVRAV